MFQFKQWISSIGKDRFLFFVAHIAYNLVLFIVAIIAAKLAGPEQWGLITLFTLIATYSSFITLGVSNGMGIALPISIGKNELEKCKDILSTTRFALFISFLPIGIIQLLIIIFWNLPISYWLILFGFTLSIQILTYFKMVLRSYESFKIFALTYLTQILCLIFGLLIIYRDFNYLVFIGSVNIIAALFVWKKTSKLSLKWSIEKETIQQILKIGLPVMSAGIVGELLLSTDRLLISIFMDNTQLGYYGFGSNFFKGIRTIGIAISMMMLPRIAKSYAKNNISDMLNYARIQQWVSFILMGMAAIIVGFGLSKYIPVLMPEYELSIRPSMVLLIVGTILPFGFYPNILNTIGRQKMYLIIQIIGIIINILVSTCFIYLGYGIDGVAFGSLISILFYIIIIRWFGWKIINNKFMKIKI